MQEVKGLNIQGALSSAGSPQLAQAQAASKTAMKVDRDGDYDNSTPASDAAETNRSTALQANGVGQNVNAKA